MGFTESDYEHLVNAFLPRGPIWHRKRGGTLDAILYALSKEAARVDARARSVIEESDPRTSIEELQRWFEDHGIPSECVAAIADPTLEQMRQELLAKITSNSGLTAKYFEELAGTLGYKAKVTVFSEHDVEHDVEAPLADERWLPVFTVGITIDVSSGYSELVPDWTVEEPLARWGSSLLECVIRALTPAHVEVLFMYDN